MTKKDEDIIETAKKRFAYAMEACAQNRDKARADVRFAAASPDDPWQWDDLDVQGRKLQMRPLLTINKLPQHIRQVTNDIRQNRPAIRYRPADDKADPEVADMLMGLVRHIEANSDADVAYDTAAENQVTHGTGYVRVLTEYISDDSFDQDIFIKRIKDTFKCYDDPDAQDPAGCDRRFFFIEDCLSEEEFKEQFPKAEPVDWSFDTKSDWFTCDKKIRIAEYFEIQEKDTKLLLWTNGETSWEGDPLPQGVIVGEVPIKTRSSKRRTVMWRKINGKQVLETRELPCRWIPVARALGNEWVIDGKSYVSGLVRNAKDSQRMYNVAQSAIVERVMQAPKSPWVGPAEAFEGYEKTWQSANTANHAFLPYNHVDENGTPIPPPQRVSPATIEPGLNQIAMGASDDIKAETGQYDASLGQKSNETSGRAIMARQREGDMATFHYIDNLGRMIRHVGRIVLDMIPWVYDTKRVARILGEDGSDANATLDPQNPQALTKFRDESGEIQRIFNPNIGTYDVYTTSGPSFSTRRMEAVDAMSAMTQANPQLWQVIGDQLVKNMDWPGADEMAERLKAVLLPEVRKQAEEPGEIPPQAQQMIDQMQGQMQQMQEALVNASREVDRLQGDRAKLEIDAYAKITDRLKLLAPAMTPAAAQLLMRETMQQAMQQSDPLPDELIAPAPSAQTGIPPQV